MTSANSSDPSILIVHNLYAREKLAISRNLATGLVSPTQTPPHWGGGVWVGETSSGTGGGVWVGVNVVWASHAQADVTLLYHRQLVGSAHDGGEWNHVKRTPHMMGPCVLAGE